MGKIFCLIGKTSSGKDTIAKHLLNEFDFKSIILFTTRPIRDGEVDGREYHFVNEEELSRLEQDGKVIEKRVYQTAHGPWTYATIDSQIDLENNNYLTLNTLEGYKKLREYYGKDIVVPIYIWVDLSTRLDRAFIREEKEEKPKYKELCRRFIEDEKDFSDNNLFIAEILEENKFYNKDFNACLNEIKDKITKELEIELEIQKKMRRINQ